MPNWYDGETFLFSCKNCGKCCSRKGVVLFNDDDIKRAAKYLEMTEYTFKKTYLRYHRNMYFLPVKGRNSPCIFYMGDHKCRIHDAKPTQCANYPFWPQNLVSKSKWDLESIYCKGIGSGETIDLKKIMPDETLLDKLTETEKQDLFCLMDCGKHKFVEKDGRCYSKECCFNENKDISYKISKEGCQVYLIYDKMASENKDATEQG